MEEAINSTDGIGVGMFTNSGVIESTGALGHFTLECHDAEGITLWEAEIDNVVCTIGKNVIENAALAGSAYTVTGPYMLLISSASFSAVSAADTMTSHAGWLEGGGSNAPTYSGNRPTMTFSAASGGTIATTGTISFVFTGSGTIQGLATTFFTGAVNTKDNTSGTLLSAGTLATPQPVINGNTVTATWSLSM